MKPSRILTICALCLGALTLGCSGKPEMQATEAVEKGALSLTIKSTSARQGLCVWKAKFKCDGKELAAIHTEKVEVPPGESRQSTIKAPCEKFNYVYTWNCEADSYPLESIKAPVFSKEPSPPSKPTSAPTQKR